jgi:hypothetical protein
MDEEYMNILMEQSTLETGKKINNMDTEWKLGQMLQSMKEIMNMEKNMELEPSSGPTAPHILVNFITIMFMEKEFILGLIIENMKENGKQIKCTVKAHSLGRMGGNILESTRKIKRRAMENSSGRMGDVTEENGSMANNMEKEPILQVEVRRNMENGRKAKELDGLEEDNLIDNQLGVKFSCIY